MNLEGKMLRILAILCINSCLAFTRSSTYKADVGWPQDCSIKDDSTITDSIGDDACEASVTWAGVAADTFSFTVSGKQSHTGQYIAMGLPASKTMGPGPVFICSSKLENKIKVQFNTKFFSSVPVNTSEIDFVALEDFKEENGTIQCTFKIKSKFDVEKQSYDLNLDKFAVIAALGNITENGEVSKHDKTFKSTDLYIFGDNNPFNPIQDYEGCDETYGCFGIPDNCITTKNCAVLSKWVKSDDLYSFKMFGEANDTDYIAFGFSNDNKMGNDSVLACLGNGNVSMYWNTASKSNIATNDTTTLSEAKSSLQDGKIQCEFKLKPTYNVTDPISNETFMFDLDSHKYFALLALGPLSKTKKLSYHILRDASSKGFDFSTVKPNDNYEGCDDIYGCFGIPNNCIVTKNCSLLSKWMKSDDLYSFQMFGEANNTDYIAFGFSNDNKMGNDSVLACLGNGNVSMYWNTASKSNIATKDTTTLSDLKSSLQDGMIHCEFKLKPSYNVTDPTSNDTFLFDLDSHKYFALLALGPLSGTKQLSYHSLRDASSKAFDFSTVNPNEPDLDYNGCQEEYGCQGMPENCMVSKNCSLLMKWKGTSSQAYQIELSAMMNDSSEYLALGFSEDNMMGNDSVIACLGNGQVGEFWNTANPFTSLPVDESATVLLESNSTYIDGKLICFFSITYLFSMKNPNDNSSYSFDLNHNMYHALLAIGPYDKDNLIQHHTSKCASSEALDFSVYNDYIQPDIYQSCYESKGCFGSEHDCIRNKNCKIMTTYQKVSPDEYQFEIGFHSSSGTGYAAVALSNDAIMGDDSAMVCIINAAKIDINMYWNTKSFNSIPLKDVHLGLTNITASYTNGYVICTFTREAITDIPNESSNLVEFDISNTSYYLLLAQGNIDTSSGTILKHDLTSKTSDKINLGTYGPIKNASALFIKLHGIAMTMAWLFFANIGVFIARYYKTHFQGKKLFGKDVWFTIHQTVMYSAILLSVLGMIPIIYEKGITPIQQKVVHSLLGLSGLSLAVLQPIVAALRCSPDHPSRPIFYWSHALIGASTLVLTSLSVLWVIWLPTQVVPDYFKWILAGVGGWVNTFMILVYVYKLIKAGEALKTLEDDRNLNYIGIVYTAGLSGLVLALCIVIILGAN